jgi:hypothetical protein
VPGTPPGKGRVALTFEADPGTPARPVDQDREPGGQTAAIVGLPGPDVESRKPISEYVRCGSIPDDETGTQHLARCAKVYQIHNDELYHRRTSGVFQRCVPTKEGKVLLLDIHERVYGHHASLRSMAGKAIRQGLYWPTAARDAA